MEGKNLVVKKLSKKNKLRPDSEGVFYCDQCAKVVGQYPSDLIGLRAAEQVAQTHTEVTGHHLEKVSRHGPSTRIDRSNNPLDAPLID
jgi:hypothetical protein